MNHNLKICLFVSLFLVLFTVPATAEEVNLSVDIILASQGGSHVDSRLSGMKGQLQSIFNFSSYELYGTENISAAMGQESRVGLPEGKVFLLKPLYFQGNMIALQARVLSGNRLIVDTQFRVSQGGSFFVGGPQTQSGVIILKVTAY